MRVEYKTLMEKLGVGFELSPYETRPWVVHDSEKGITCSAEVRVGPGGEDVEAEIQFLHEEEEDTESTGGSGGFGRPEQIMLMRFLPSKDQVWVEKLMYVKGEDYAPQIHNWGERGCEFFQTCIGAMQMDEIPEIDDLIETILTDKSGGRGGRKGRVGKKGFKVEQKPIPMMGGKP